jgi:hypothetical protein
MCANCISRSEQVVAEAAFLFAVFRGPAHNALAAAGVVEPIDPVKRDVRTVAFLRRLELDPDEILGAEVVERADAWVPQGRKARQPLRWWRPIGSQSSLATA